MELTSAILHKKLLEISSNSEIKLDKKQEILSILQEGIHQLATCENQVEIFKEKYAYTFQDIQKSLGSIVNI